MAHYLATWHADDLSSDWDEIDIHIPKRTLQYYLDSDMLKCKDDRVQKVADFLIKSFDETILNLKTVID